MYSSLKIDIVVKNEGQPIGRRPNSPVRKLPDGTAGVVVSGFVYAVHEDHSIDIAENGIPKVDCPEFFRPDEDLVYLAKDESEGWWFCEETRNLSYLAFDGSESFAERLNSAFAREGLSNGYRESFRPAKNGYFYDYFIRLPPHANKADVLRIVASVSEEDADDDSDESFQEVVGLVVEELGGPRNLLRRWAEIVNSRALLEQEIKGLRDSDLMKQQALDVARAELADERRERNGLRSQIESLEIERDRLLNELKASKAVVTDADTSWDDLKSMEIDRLFKEVSLVRKERDLVRLEVEDLRSEVKEGRALIGALETQLETLKAEQRPTEHLPIERTRTSKKEKKILNDILSGAFPRLDLQDADLKALLRDFVSIDGCARVMADLQEGRKPPHTKGYQGMKGVFEVEKVNTGIKGREDLGRIYFRMAPNEGRVHVAIHVKEGDGKQQEIFVKNRFRMGPRG